MLGGGGGGGGGGVFGALPLTGVGVAGLLEPPPPQAVRMRAQTLIAKRHLIDLGVIGFNGVSFIVKCFILTRRLALPATP